MAEKKMAAPVLAHWNGPEKELMQKLTPILPLLRAAVKTAAVTLGIYILAAVAALNVPGLIGGVLVLNALLGVSKSTVLRLIRAGEFGQTVNVARQHLVTEDGLSEFVAAHTGPPTTNTRRTKKPRRGAADRNPGPI